jgi:hypothetical protein
LKGRGSYAVYQYVITFKGGQLPARKREKHLPFMFVNDVALDRLAALNKKINEGVTIESLRKDLARSEKSVAEKEKIIDDLKKESILFDKLYRAGVRRFENRGTDMRDFELLSKYEITAGSYFKIPNLIADNDKEIADIEKSLSDERAKMKDTSETLTAFEDLYSMTYVQKLIEAEKNRIQAKKVGSGIKSADLSISESQKIDEVVEKVVEAVEKKNEEPIVQYQPPKPPRR